MAAALPHSNGKVGMFSGSYVGATQMFAAIGKPPHLAGICPIVTASNYHENWTYQGGAFEQWFNESWTSGLVQDTALRHHETLPPPTAINALVGAPVLPLTQFPVFNVGTPKKEPPPPPTSRPTSSTGPPTPTTTTTGASGPSKRTTRTFRCPPSPSPPGTTSSSRALCATTWASAITPPTPPPAPISASSLPSADTPAGAANRRSRLRPQRPLRRGQYVLEWSDYLFLGKQNQFADAAHPVKVFTMGDNQWRSLSAWPPSESKPTRYFLHSGSNANSAAGDGILWTPPMEVVLEGTDHFTYDPANPVPTVGGPLCCDSNHLQPGPRDQKAVEARPDVLVYSTFPLGQDLNVTGPVSLEMHASSTAPDTDFTAKLVERIPDGRAINIT